MNMLATDMVHTMWTAVAIVEHVFVANSDSVATKHNYDEQSVVVVLPAAVAAAAIAVVDC